MALQQQHANGVRLLFTFYSLDHRWRSACRVFVSWIWSSTRGDVDVCVVFFRSSFGSQQILIPHKRRHYFQRCVDGGSPTAANTPVLFSFLFFFFFLPVSSLALMPHRSGWSCSLREASSCSSLSRMLMRPSLRLLLPLLLQVLRTLCRPTDEGMTPPFPC